MNAPAPIIPEKDRRRAVAAAALLASDKEGEVVAAAAALVRLRKPHGTTPASLIDKALAPELRCPPRMDDDHCRVALACLAFADRLNGWEIDFLISVSRRPWLSAKQSAKLRVIELKLGDSAHG